MSLAHFEWDVTGSTLNPMILTLRLSNSGLILAMYPSSVVQTGVKSLGWEKSTPQELPSHSWNRIFPCVVSASKSGAVSPILRVIVILLINLSKPRSSIQDRPDAIANSRAGARASDDAQG